MLRNLNYGHLHYFWVVAREGGINRASVALDLACDEYDQAAAHFDGSRSGAIFGRSSKRARQAASGEFMANLRNGFAFNLPIVILGGGAMALYVFKTFFA